MISHRIKRLPNPHTNCVRELLSSLVCFENEYGRMTIELRNLKEEYARKMEEVVFPYTDARKPDPISKCADPEKLDKVDFEANVERADVLVDCYERRIRVLMEERDRHLYTARNCLISLNMEKCKFKKFHERSLSELKRQFGSTLDQRTRANCQKDINMISKMFADEVSHIQKCEASLRAFIDMLSADTRVKETCTCCFKQYEWIPGGNQ